MIHLSVVSPKGGVGKTMIALQLAASFARDGHRTCLVDHDPQGSSLVFGKLAERAGIELPFVPTCARVSGFDVYIHDHPPGLAEAYPSRIAIVPTLLDAPSFLIHRRGLRHLEERGLIVVPVASRFRSDRKQQRDLVAEHFIDQPIIKDRDLYPTLYGRGLTVVDGRGVPHLGKAKNEIEVLRMAVDAAIAPTGNGS
ncbi:P-loop NTPase [Stenotrophomonas sp. GD03937]|uniref:nucleotide-binding protein n=1 Tax=Stenotrophomonas sp. GD03937 TaxID=2975408 RepID=UPI00244B59E8|nr:P-loop NTPase [Stenotrophomonas sp. GD03937]MDH1274126.1 AAA family ATPase [Stenotrophomonas sp. GD03937]